MPFTVMPNAASSRASEKVSEVRAPLEVEYAVPAVSPPVLAASEQVLTMRPQRGAFIPGIVLSGLYAGYIMLLSFVKPAWVPALPEAARTFREPDGSPGTRSLMILVAISAASGIA